MERTRTINYTKTLSITFSAILMVAISCFAHVQTAWAATAADPNMMLAQNNDGTMGAVITLLAIVAIASAIGGIAALRAWKHSQHAASDSSHS